MKKIISLILVIAIALLVGCSVIDTDTKNNYIQDNLEVSIIIDKETGINYIANYKGGVTPRLNADGTLYVSEVKDNE